MQRFLQGRALGALVVPGLALACGQTARAQVIFSNFGPGDTYDTVGYGVAGANIEPGLIGRFDLAGTFTTDTGSYSHLKFEGGFFHNEGPTGLILRLHGDLGFAPDNGNVLATSGILNAVDYPGGIISWVLPGSVSLAPDTTYWFSAQAADPNGFFGWNFNTTLDYGVAFWGGNTLFPWIGNAGPAPAFRVSVDASAPEPSSISLVGFGAGALLLRARRTRRRLTR